MKKLLYTLFILILLVAIGFFMAAGRIVDGQKNLVIKAEHDIPNDIKEFHDSLIIADWHADNLLWDRNPLIRLEHGHVDVPRLIEGNVAVQVFDAVIKTPKGMNYESNTGDTDNITLLAMANRWPVRAWGSLYERAIHQSNVLHDAEAQSDGQLRILKTADDLETHLKQRTEGEKAVGGILAIEGLHALEGELSNLDGLFEAGYRVMGLVHFFDNEVAGSSAGAEKGGLTDFGRQVVRRMNELGIIIDLAHSSAATIRDVLALSTKPVVVTHTGVRGTHDIVRNLSDEEIRGIVSRGGVIGVGFWDGAVGDYRPQSIVRAMRYVSDLVGIEHVCLGSDWDGSTTVYFDAANLAVLTQALLEGGFSREEVSMIMGGNQVEFLRANL